MIQAEQMTIDDFWFLNGRLRRKEGTRQLRLECNYDGHNWIYDLFDRQGIGELIKANTMDNSEHLPKDYIESLKKLPERIQRIHFYGSDEEAEGLVFDEFRQHEHIITPFNIPSTWEITEILDHGVTNPTAVLWMATDYDGNLFVFDEHYKAGESVSFHSEAIKARYKDLQSPTFRWADPSVFAKTSKRNNRLMSVADEYLDNGIIYSPADNDVLGGINRVNEYLKAGKLKIFKSCTNLIDEVHTYKWQRLKPGEDKNEPDKPLKRKDHLCDCLRYGVFSRPSSPVHEDPLPARNTFRGFELQEEKDQETKEALKEMLSEV